MNDFDTTSNQPGSLVAPDDLEIGRLYCVHSLKGNPWISLPLAGESFRLVAVQFPFIVGQLAAHGIPITVDTRFNAVMRVSDEYAAAQRFGVDSPPPAVTPPLYQEGPKENEHG